MRVEHNPVICLLGCGGFIGSHLLCRLLAGGAYSVIGVDIASDRIQHLLDHPHFEFVCADVYDTAALEPLIAKSSIVISLVALCNPWLYTTRPVEVIEINYLHPLNLIRQCSAQGQWLIQFSTSEVYGKTVAAVAGLGDDASHQLLDEDTTPFVLGPLAAQRWCYAAAKQLLERTIYAWGFERNLRYTIVRPFNFIGPRMDYIPGVDGEGIPRVMACFMEALMKGQPLKLVDGGESRRVFTYIDDAVDAVCAMLAHPVQARNQVFNIGNPANEVSIAQLAQRMIDIYRRLRMLPPHHEIAITKIDGCQLYGEGYEDSDRRIPSIAKAQRLLQWQPRVGLEDALEKTMQGYIDYYTTRLEQAV